VGDRESLEGKVLMTTRCALALALVVALAGSVQAQVRAGAELLVNTYTTDSQFFASAAISPDGDFVVVWESYSGQDGDLTGVFGQRFDRTGARRGGEFQVNSYTTGYQGYIGHVAVAADRQGRFVVAWPGAVRFADGWEVFARRFDAGGLAAGPDFQVNTPGAGSDGGLGYNTDVSVAATPRGDFVVVWASYGATTADIKGQRFDAQGRRLGGELLVNSASGRHAAPSVAVNARGEFVVAWASYAGSAYDYDVTARRFAAGGAPVGAQFQVNTYTTGIQGYVGLFAPAVALADSGSFTVLWNSIGQEGDDGIGLFAQAFDAAGSRVGGEFRVNSYTTGSQGFFTARGDAHGNVVATWQSAGQDGSSTGVFAQRLAADGRRRGGEFQVNTFTTGFEGVPGVAADRAGNFAIAWHGPREGSTGVLLQRFGGLLPTALDVDTAGNRVLEPGETADVRPTWRNVNGAAQAFGATLSTPGGPAGGVPSIVDGSGDYGTVADGAAASCTDCYRVAVPDPSSRPALHWDGSVVESISPDAQGQQKTWPLHVGRSFADVPAASPFYRFVEALLHYGVSGGCTADAYCPATAATREQMAVFVLVAKEGAGEPPPACAAPVFGDVPASSPFCRFIEELARRGVVGGCGGGNYCPGQAVTREQMAVFTLRTLDPSLDPPACGTPVFADVPASSPFCRWIEELARRQVVAGCGGGNYCPTQPVTREQMGVFIGATFGLSLYGV